MGSEELKTRRELLIGAWRRLVASASAFVSLGSWWTRDGLGEGIEQAKKWVRECGLTIDEPIGNQPCEEGTGKVCVKGAGAILGLRVAEEVYAKIYQPPFEPSNPEHGPPADAVAATPDSRGNWCIGLVPGADCSAAVPYPDNAVWVWAKYHESSSYSSSNGDPCWHYTNQHFQGKEVTDVPSCCDLNNESQSQSISYPSE